jgi:hypothetical protein
MRFKYGKFFLRTQMAGLRIKPKYLTGIFMSQKKLPADFEYVPDMYSDEYFPKFLVDKIKETIKKAVVFIEVGNHSKDEIQGAFDQMTVAINELQEEFEENDSDLETEARESIGETVEKIIKFFGIDIGVEEAIRERDW